MIGQKGSSLGWVLLALVCGACASAGTASVSTGTTSTGTTSPSTASPVSPCDPQPWVPEDSPRFSEGPNGGILEVEGVPVAPPGLLNSREVGQELGRAYAPFLREAVNGGRPPTGIAFFWLQVDEHGEITERLMARSSGHGELDGIAGRVIGLMELRPAFRQGCYVGSWVLWPVIFRFFRGEPPSPDVTTPTDTPRLGGP